MTEIVWDELTDGNTAKKPEKIIQADCFRAKMYDRAELRREQERRNRQKEVEMIRLTLQAIALISIFFMISLIDAADMAHTVILLALIIGCSAFMILLGNNKKER